MKLFELFTAGELQAQIDAAMVKRTPDPTGQLFILNYTKRAQYTPELWSRVTDQCRGLIVDAADNVVARPFEKFWNLDDPRHPAAPDAGRRFFEFFTVNIRNANTRKAYFRAVAGFAAWCKEHGLFDLSAVTPMHVAAYVEQLSRTHSKPTVKQHLAAVRMLFAVSKSGISGVSDKSIGLVSLLKSR